MRGGKGEEEEKSPLLTVEVNFFAPHTDGQQLQVAAFNKKEEPLLLNRLCFLKTLNPLLFFRAQL